MSLYNPIAATKPFNEDVLMILVQYLPNNHKMGNINHLYIIQEILPWPKVGTVKTEKKAVQHFHCYIYDRHHYLPQAHRKVVFTKLCQDLVTRIQQWQLPILKQ